MSRKPDRRTVRNTLIRARGLLAQRGGWIQGEYNNHDNTAFCMLGAIHRSIAEGGSKHVIELRDASCEALYPVIGNRDITYWNDALSRRKHQVLAAFDQAIESLAPSTD